MMQVIGVPTYARLLEPWEGQYAPRGDLEALGRTLCEQLGILAPGVEFSRRHTTRKLGTYQCGTVLNYDRLVEEGQEWWSVGTQLHELAHHVDRSFDRGRGAVAEHARVFWDQLHNAVALAGRDYYVGSHQPDSHGPRFYLACQMLHKLAQRYLTTLSKGGQRK